MEFYKKPGKNLATNKIVLQSCCHVVSLPNKILSGISFASDLKIVKYVYLNKTTARHSDRKTSSAVLQGKYRLDFVLNVRALLHYFEGVLTRSALSRVTGINERQLGHYITGHRKPRPEQRKKIVEGIRRIGKEINSVV
ncbi:MAG: hypothetical protein EPN88_14625 [Bacteroidetes bacterium]|nr:MAG: hypothetical protein EPN88_14625 [Bacteroidota bacterium]